MKTILLIFTLFICVCASAQYTCAEATSITISSNCEMRQYDFENNSNIIWLKFTASHSDFEFIIENSFQNSQWQLSNLESYVGTCSSLVQLDSINLTSSVDTINFDSLTVNQDYFIRIEKQDSTLNSFYCCITPKAMENYWQNNFYNSAGTSLLNCATYCPIDLLDPYGNQNCNDITICINDLLFLENVSPFFLGTGGTLTSPLEHVFNFVTQNGASFSTSSDLKLTTLSFSQVGTVTFRLVPLQIFSSGFTNLINEPEFIFTVHVIDDAPEAIWDNNVICDNGIATLSTLDGSVFTNSIYQWNL